jgi:Fur family transcriptional regulator, ferric uptake regulator
VIKNKLLNLLEKSHDPISVPDILSKISANKTTIYRELQEFLSDGLISEVDFGDGKKRYELTRDHHHHLVCKDCGKVEDIKIDEKKILENINNQSNFLIEKHSMEFFGKCLKCQL